MSGVARARAAVASLARSAALPLGVGLGLLAASLWLEHVAVLNHDAGWLLLGARRLLDGAQLYVDGFVDVNPPGILYWMTPVVAASDASGLSETRVFPAYVWLWCLGSLWLCARWLRAHFDASQLLARRWLLAALVFVIGIWPAAGFDVLPVHSLGQREHLVVAWLLPGVLLAALRLQGRSAAPALAALTGALAGLAVCVKPHYAVCIAAFELHRRLRLRALRPLATPELAATGAVCAAYLASLALITPDYLSHALPLALDTYWAYQKPLLQLIESRDLIVLAGALALRFLVRRQPAVSALCDALAVASFAAYAGFLLGGTSWPYHKLPFRSFALVEVFVAALAPVAGAARALRPRWLEAVTALAAAVASAWLVQRLPWQIDLIFNASAHWKGLSVDLWQERLAREAPGGPLLVLSSGLPPAFPLVNYAGIGWSSRFSCQWVLPALMRARERGEGPASLDARRVDALEAWLMSATMADVDAAPPGLVLVQKTAKTGFDGMPFDFLAYYLRDPRFRRFWSHYRYSDSLLGYDVYVRAASLQN